MEGARATARSIELLTPVSFSFRLLRLTAIVVTLSAVCARLVLPGVRGLLEERTVVAIERVSGTLSYAAVALLVALLATGSFELARLTRASGFFRGALIGLMSLALATASPSLGMQLGPLASIALSFVTSIIALLAAASAVRAPHTRATAMTLLLFGLGNVAHLVAWVLAQPASDGSSHFVAARVVATISVSALICALGAATVWLGTRTRLRGTLLSVASLGVSALAAYVALRNSDTESVFLTVIRRSLAEAETTPAPYAISALAVFAVTACIALALSSSSLATHDVAGPVLALLLVSQAEFDVPISALSALAAAIWLPLLAQDPRAMWQSVLVARKERAAQTNAPKSES